MINFDSITLIPQISSIKSRLDVDLSCQLGPYELKAPVIATNMSTVTGKEMCRVMAEEGCIGALHRFMPKDALVNIAREFYNDDIPYIFSVGVNGVSLEALEELKGTPAYPKVILIDIAHGHHTSVAELIQELKKYNNETFVIAGNIATYEGYRYLLAAGADMVRTSVAGGSVCTTRLVTGYHVPTAEAIKRIRAHAVVHPSNLDWRPDKATLIADGGIRNSGDCVKALALGAHFVCLGGYFAGSSATPGDVIQTEHGPMKKFFGMSSSEAQEQFFGQLRDGIAAEGRSELVPYKGETSKLIRELLGGIKSGLSYSGASNLTEFRQKVVWAFLD